MEEKLEKIIEQKIKNQKQEIKKEAKKEIKQETKQLKKENQRLKKRLQRLENQKTTDPTPQKEKEEDEEVSRREFLKKLGAGALGLGALSLPGASALNVKTANSFDVFTTATEGGTLGRGFTVDTDQNVSIPNGYLDLSGNSLTDTTQSYIDFTGDGNNLRMSTGQSIEDGGGVRRVGFNSESTRVNNDGEDSIINLNDGSFSRLQAYSDQPIDILDMESGAVSVQYDTDATSGVLRTPNAGFAVQGDGFQAGASGMNLRHDGVRSVISTFDGTDRIPLKLTASLVDLSQDTANLRLATGQSIEDGSGNNRLSLDTTRTVLSDDAGRSFIAALSNNVNQLRAYSDQPITIRDLEQDKTAVKYITSSSAPGLLSLNNAKLNLDFNRTQISGFDDKSLHWFEGPNGTEPENLGLGFLWNSSTSSIDRVETRCNIRLGIGSRSDDIVFAGDGSTQDVVWPDQGGGYEPLVGINGNGEVDARDDEGNFTTLT